MTGKTTGSEMKQRRLLTGIIIILSFSVLLACAETAATPAAASYVANAANAPLVTSSALQPTIENAQVMHYLQAIQAEQQRQEAEATLSVFYAQQTATMQASLATATQQARQSTATAQANQATATAMAWQTTVEAANAQATATAAVLQATATAEAATFQQNATATAGAWALGTTATAQAQAFQATGTTQAQAIEATSTIAAAQAFATAQAAEAERVRQAALREQIVYPIKAFGPWILLMLGTVLMIWGGYRLIRAWELRIRAIPRDERGDARLIVFDQRGGKFVVLDPDRAFGPATVVGKGISQPRLAAPDQQAQVTARDQAIDLAHRGLPGGTRSPARRSRKKPRQQASKIMSQQAPASAGRVRVVRSEQIRSWLHDVMPLVLHDALTLKGELNE